MECNSPCVLHASGLPDISLHRLMFVYGITTRWMRFIGDQYVC